MLRDIKRERNMHPASPLPKTLQRLPIAPCCPPCSFDIPPRFSPATRPFPCSSNRLVKLPPQGLCKRCSLCLDPHTPQRIAKLTPSPPFTLCLNVAFSVRPPLTTPLKTKISHLTFPISTILLYFLNYSSHIVTHV